MQRCAASVCGEFCANNNAIGFRCLGNEFVASRYDLVPIYALFQNINSFLSIRIQVRSVFVREMPHSCSSFASSPFHFETKTNDEHGKMCVRMEIVEWKTTNNKQSMSNFDHMDSRWPAACWKFSILFAQFNSYLIRGQNENLTTERQRTHRTYCDSTNARPFNLKLNRFAKPAHDSFRQISRHSWHDDRARSQINSIENNVHYDVI